MFTKPTFDNWFENALHLNADRLGEEYEWNLTNRANFSIPDIDWSDFDIPEELLEALKKGPRRLTEADLTERIPRGKGMFDAIMESFSKHLLEEFDANRITGAEYTKAYTALTNSAIQGAIQYLTSQEQLYWQSIAAQLAAIQAVVNINLAKVQLATAIINTHNARATYAGTKLDLSTKGAQYALVQEQTKKASEDAEASRAQTANTRLDGNAVLGVMGKQRDMYQQQIYSFQHNDQKEATKLKTDAWTVMKTADEGLEPPNSFTNASLDASMTNLINNVFKTNV